MKHLLFLFWITFFFCLSTICTGQNQSVILVDDFSIFPNNALGGESDGYPSHPGESFITLTTERGFKAFGHTGKSLKVDYDLTRLAESFVIFSSSLLNLDLSDHHYLSFWVKGSQGREYFSIELKGANNESSKVAVWDYLECGPTPDWQKVVIPLDAFWKLSERNNLTQLNFVFEEFQSAQNGSPVKGRVLFDDITFGSHFLGRLKVDSFDDRVGSNATGGNNGAFGKESTETHFTEGLYCQPPFEQDCDCQQKINYNVDAQDGDEFGGTFYVLGGGEDGFTGTPKNLSRYHQLYLEMEATNNAANPGVVKVELKAETTPYSTKVRNITTRNTGFTIPFDDFKFNISGNNFIKLDITQVNQLALVFERNSHDESRGSIFVDNIEFRASDSIFPDNAAPGQLMVLNVDGQLPSDPVSLSGDTATVSLQMDETDEKLESLSLEYQRNCVWYTAQTVYAPLSDQFDFKVALDQLPAGIPLQLRVVSQNYNGKTSYSDTFEASIQREEALDVNQLLRYSFDALHSLRYETGVYLDATVFEGTPFHPASVATTGMGLISLCIGDAMGYIDHAEMLVEETLKSMNGLKEGFTPERNCYGWFRHFIDQSTGIQAWDSEFSSIDSGILIAGALFCKKYFSQNETIVQLADSLYLTTKWSSMLADAESGGIYLTADEFGQGGAGITLPFNEYMIVAWLAKNDVRDDSLATLLWDKHFADPVNLPKSSYEDIEVLTDFPGNFLSDFVSQFVYYLCNYYTTSTAYNQYFENAMRADSLWWRNNTDTDCFVWGFGAGASPVQSGYHADDIGAHPGIIASPHIIGGFIPANPDLVYDLINLYTTTIGVYEMPTLEDTPILWRYSYEDPSWQAGDIQGIDFSSMVLGLAAHPDALGVSFFKKYNDFDFPSDGPIPSCVPGFNVNLQKDYNILKLDQNQPNPFREKTIIKFTQSKRMPLSFTVVDTGGREVFRQDLGTLLRGEHQIQWDGKNQQGRPLPAGVYFFSIRADQYFDIKKMIIVK